MTDRTKAFSLEAGVDKDLSRSVVWEGASKDSKYLAPCVEVLSPQFRMNVARCSRSHGACKLPEPLGPWIPGVDFSRDGRGSKLRPSSSNRALVQPRLQVVRINALQAATVDA